eukprot:9677833-Prorocentrum_lima.AAC.1
MQCTALQQLWPELVGPRKLEVERHRLPHEFPIIRVLPLPKTLQMNRHKLNRPAEAQQLD